MAFLLVLIIIMLVCLLFEIARVGTIIFSILVILLVTKLITPKEALSGFSNEGMLTVALLFIIAGAVQKSGLIDQLMEKWLKNSRTDVGSMFRFFIPIALCSAFLNNTPIVVTFTPIIKNWCVKRGISPSKFLIPLSYITILGGTITLIGTSTNIVVHGMLLDYGLKGFSLFTLTIVGIPLTIVGFVYLFTLGIKLLPDHQGFTERVKEDAREYIAEVQVEPHFPFINKSVEKAGLESLNGLYLVEIIRKNGRVSPVRDTTIIQKGDRLIFSGNISTIAQLQKRTGLTLRTGTNVELDDLKNGDIYLVEAVVSHQSSLLSKSIKQSHFRSRYDAGVLAIHRNNERIGGKVGDVILKAGDALLLIAGKEFLRKYEQSNDFYVVSRLKTPRTLEQHPGKGLFSILLLITLIIIVSIGWLTMLEAMAIAVVILLLTGVVDSEEIKKNMQFHVLFVIASSLGIGVAMTKTGLAEWIAMKMIAIGAPFGIVALLVMMYMLTNIFTELITNTAAAVLMLPIGIEMAHSYQLDPMGFAVLVAIAASASFITPIGYQTNLIVYAPGGYTFMDYVKVGAPLSLLVMVTSVAIIYHVWF